MTGVKLGQLLLESEVRGDFRPDQRGTDHDPKSYGALGGRRRNKNSLTLSSTVSQALKTSIVCARSPANDRATPSQRA